MAASRLGSRRPSLVTDYGFPNELELGDTVEVPGGNRGTVKYIGAVQGKNGVFVGVELNRDSAAFGKNNGEVEGYVIELGVHYDNNRLIGKECSTLHAQSLAPVSSFLLFEQ